MNHRHQILTNFPTTFCTCIFRPGVRGYSHPHEGTDRHRGDDSDAHASENYRKHLRPLRWKPFARRLKRLALTPETMDYPVRSDSKPSTRLRQLNTFLRPWPTSIPPAKTQNFLNTPVPSVFRVI